MTESQLRDDICRVGNSLFDRGYVHATAGNISVRVDDGYLITPTDACLGFLDPARIAKLDANLVQISGDKTSKTIALHAAIYQATHAHTALSNTNAVIHTHSTACVAATMHDEPRNATRSESHPELLPPITPYFVMKVGHVPLIPYHRPGDPAVAHSVAQQIGQFATRGLNLRAIMLSRLGPNVWHDSLSQAMAVLEELEETAKLWNMFTPKPAPLSEAQIDELRQAFGASW